MELDFPDRYTDTHTSGAAGSLERCLDAWDGTPGFLIHSKDTETGRHLTFLVIHDGHNDGWVIEGTEQERSGTHLPPKGEAHPLREGVMPGIRKWLTPMVNRIGFNEMWVDAHMSAMEPTAEYGRAHVGCVVVARQIVGGMWRPVQKAAVTDVDRPVPNRDKLAGWLVDGANVPVGAIYPLGFQPDDGAGHNVGTTIVGPTALWG